MTSLLQIAGWTLIHFVWEGCAIAAVAATALRLADRRSANVRYVIACVGRAAMRAAPAATARLLWVSNEPTFSAIDGGQAPPTSESSAQRSDRIAKSSVASALKRTGERPADAEQYVLHGKGNCSSIKRSRISEKQTGPLPT